MQPNENQIIQFNFLVLGEHDALINLDFPALTSPLILVTSPRFHLKRSRKPKKKKITNLQFVVILLNNDSVHGANFL